MWKAQKCTRTYTLGKPICVCVEFTNVTKIYGGKSVQTNGKLNVNIIAWKSFLYVKPYLKRTCSDDIAIYKFRNRKEERLLRVFLW